MPIEIEKKYRLTKQQRRSIEKKLRELGVLPGEEEFEENIVYRGGRLELGGCALRLRRVNNCATMTFKQRFPSKSAIKYQQEEETAVANPDATHAIISALGFRVGLVYEKRRVRWDVGKAAVVIDELPFGLFMEIEATEREIKRIEKLLAAEKLPPVMETYPGLTMRLGKQRKGIFEARFPAKARGGKARNAPRSR